jgi:hypothetical protein
MNFNLNILDHGYHDEHQYGDGKYEYEWSKVHNYEYVDASIVTNGYSEVSLFPGEQSVKIGDRIHVVYVSYDTGDSFGRESDARVHLWAFSDPKRAERLAQCICTDAQANTEYDFDENDLVFDGVDIATYTWKGYFETFITADVISLIVTK